MPMGKSRLRILGFLSRRRNRVEADVGEENMTLPQRQFQRIHAEQTTPVHPPIASLDIVGAQGDHKKHDRDFNHHDAGVKARSSL